MHLLSPRWIKIGVSLSLLVVLFWSVDFAVLFRQIAAANPLCLTLALFGYLGGQVASAAKWKLLARPLGFHQTMRTFAICYFSGMYLNLFAPSTLAGDVGRALFLGETRERVGAALQSVLADRLTGVVMLLWVSATGFVMFGPTVLPAAVCYGVIAAAVTAVGLWWLLPWFVRSLFAPYQKVRSAIERTIAPYQTNAGLVVAVCGVSFAFHMYQLGLQLLIARALELPVPFWYLMLFVPLVHVVSALPFSFAGLGLREAGYVVFLAQIGIARDEALALGLVWSGLVLSANLLGGLVLLLSPSARISLVAFRKRTAA